MGVLGIRGGMRREREREGRRDFGTERKYYTRIIHYYVCSYLPLLFPIGCARDNPERMDRIVR